MESILARALEYTLKYWLKSFSRDQFKLQGRCVQLSNLDINGDALHSSIGLPPALNVTTAKVGKLTITLPSVSNVQIEPIVVQINRLDLVLEENPDAEPCRSPSTPSTSSSGWGSGYGFADKIADGMTVEISTVNLLLDTRGGGRHEGGAAWAAPLASITMRNLVLCTTNENWQVVNLKEAREFFNSSKYIYVFKKLVWESLSVDLLPHPDMFTEANLARAQVGANQRDDDGAKRVFFGGERFLEGISGEAYITVKRTDLNRPLGLEVQLHITEAVCPALSEPGLRALLRFLTGVYICLNRGDIDLKAQQGSAEAAGQSLVSIVVDHIFLCIKDAEFQLELLMQSLHFSRASVSDGEIANYLTTVMIGGLFLRDTFSRPPCTLVQPSMEAVMKDPIDSPAFAKNFCPPIYPLGEHDWQKSIGVPLICLHSLQVKPSPAPPLLASETAINCQPLMIFLEEKSCLRISSFLADGIVVTPGSVLPDFSVNSLLFTLKELHLTVPLEMEKRDALNKRNDIVKNSFNGARLHIENLLFSESPFLKLRQLNLDKDPACFCLWEGQPVDASQKKWTAGASKLSLSLVACTESYELHECHDKSLYLWKCVDMKDVCIEVAMATLDGSALKDVPPPGGIVRVGISCQQYLSNTSIEQLFFVLDLYADIGRLSEEIAVVGKKSRPKKTRSLSDVGTLMDKVPSDTAVSLSIADLQLRFLESSSAETEGMPLVQFLGEDFFIKVSHRTLGGAVAISSSLCWESIEVACVDTKEDLAYENGLILSSGENGHLKAWNRTPQLKAVLWIHKKTSCPSKKHCSRVPFLDISIVQVIPFNELDLESRSLSVSACIQGVRLGGGMTYAESLLHRFGILGPDGGPGEGLVKGLENLSSGPLGKLFKTSQLRRDNLEKGKEEDSGLLHMAKPDNVDIQIEFRDWLFALEGQGEMAERWNYNTSHVEVVREAKSWHTTFQSLRLEAKSDPKHFKAKNDGPKYPVESVNVSINGLQAVKPQTQKEIISSGLHVNGFKDADDFSDGINLDVRMVLSEDDTDNEMANWGVENLKFSVKKPIEAIVTKDELQHLVYLCKAEVDSMGRIAAGVLRVLKLEGSIGQAAIDQLSNLGSEGLERILTPERLSRRNSSCSIGLTPRAGALCESFLTPRSSALCENLNPGVQTTLTYLEEAVAESQAKCADLLKALGGTVPSQQQLGDVEELTHKLESMQFLLKQLRNQI